MKKNKKYSIKKAQFGDDTKGQVNPNPSYDWTNFNSSPSPHAPVPTNPIATMDISKNDPQQEGLSYNNGALTNNRSGRQFDPNGELNPYVQGANYLMQGITSIANQSTEMKNRQDEQMQWLKGNTPKAWENMEQYGLNANPMYSKYGGDVHKYQVGGGTSAQSPSQIASANSAQWMQIAEQLKQAQDSYDRTYNTVYNAGTQEGWNKQKLDTEIKKATAKQTAIISQLQSQIPKKYAFGGDPNDPGEGGGGKPKSVVPSNPNVFTSQAEIDRYNNFVQDFATRHPNYATAISPSETYAGRNIGDLKPQFVYEGGVPPVNKPKPVTVPDYINQSDIQQAGGSYWYEDKDGHSVDVDPSVVNLPRFRAEQQRAVAAKAAGIPESEQPKYQTGGVRAAQSPLNSIAPAQPNYHFGMLTQSPNSKDSAEYNANFNNIINNHPAAMQMLYQYNKYGVNTDLPVDAYKYGLNQYNAYTDAMNQMSNPETRKPIPQFWHQPKRQNGGELQGLPEGQEHLANVEAEKGEVVQNQDGSVQKISDNAPTHEEGGVFLPDVHRVLENTSNLRNDKKSKYLKLGSDEVNQLTGADVKGSMSHAEALEKADEYYEKDRAKIVKNIQLASKGKQQLDKLAENSTKLNMDTLKQIPSREQIFEQLFNHQEAVKDSVGIADAADQAKYGGVPEAKSGIDIKKSHEGRFTKYLQRTGKTVDEALHSKDPHVRQMANFAKNAKHFKHQNGGEVPKYSLGGDTDPVDPYKKAKTKAGATMPNGQDNSYNKGPEYLNSWEKIIPGISKLDNSTAQGKIYDYMMSTPQGQQRLNEMWHTNGLTAKGMRNPAIASMTNKGMFASTPLSKDQLSTLKDSYVDGMFGRRQVDPYIPEAPKDGPAPAANEPNQPVDAPERPINFINNPKSNFNEPLRWYDVASPLNAYLNASERIPEKYNGSEAHQLRYKLQDPTAALNQNQADFNSGVQATNNSVAGAGSQQANIANLAASKYAANNQILGQTENQNAGIKNNEIAYNTQVRDRQSVADQQARENFTEKVLTSRAKQDEQKLTALDSLYKTYAENRALNRNGNLMMKFAPAFDQYGNYNGYQHQFALNPMSMIPQYNPNAVSSIYGTQKYQPAGKIQSVKPGQNYYNDRTGAIMPYYGGQSFVR